MTDGGTMFPTNDGSRDRTAPKQCPRPRSPWSTATLANEVVIMGAHLDTVPYATGATDNATGSAAMMKPRESSRR